MTAWLLLLWAADPAATSRPADTIVVAAPDMTPALRPWFALRQKQGHTLALLPNHLSKERLKESLRAAAKDGHLKNVVFVGDAVAGRQDDAARRARLVPTHLHKAEVNVHFGSEPEIASDNYFADLNDDHLPDVALGRLAADDPEELARIVAKIVHYETSHDHGTWRERINLIAGVGGFGAVVDSVLEMATRKFLCDGIPSSYTTSMTYGSWNSPFCPDPRRFHEATMQRLNEGALFWVYIGHGHKTTLDRVQTPGGQFHIMAAKDATGCRCPAGQQPIAVFLACYTGAFDQPEDCLAEELLKQEAGPVAVLSGSRVTMPYAMAVMGTAMLDEYFQQRRETLGEIVLHAKRRMMTPDDKHPNRALLDAVAQAMSPRKDLLEAERREHLYLFNLLGDPLLRLKHAEELSVSGPTAADAGGEIEIAGSAPFAGAARVELLCRRDQLKYDLPARSRFSTDDEALAAYQDIYEAANDRIWSQETVKLEAGAFRTTLKIPAECRGFCHVRVTAADKERHAVGACNLYVRSAKKGQRLCAVTKDYSNDFLLTRAGAVRPLKMWRAENNLAALEFVTLAMRSRHIAFS